MMGKWLKRLFKISLVLGLVLGAVALVLGNMGGAGDTYKSSIEDLVSESTGYHTRILQMNNMRFFPNVIFNFNNMELYDTPDEELIVARLGQAHAVLSFWDVVFQNGRFKYLYVKDLFVRPGVLTRKAIILDLLNIQKDEEGLFFIKAEGAFEEYDFSWQLPLKTIGQGHRQTFEFEPGRLVSANIGEASIEGVVNHESDTPEINALKITLKDRVLTKDNVVKVSDGEFIVQNEIASQDLKELIEYLEMVLGRDEDAFLRLEEGGGIIVGDQKITFSKSE